MIFTYIYGRWKKMDALIMLTKVALKSKSLGTLVNIIKRFSPLGNKFNWGTKNGGFIYCKDY